MKRNVESMTERELLAELVLQGRRAEHERAVRYCVIALIVLALVILGAIYIPRVIAPLREISESLEQISLELGQVDEFFNGLGEGSAEKFRQSIENFNEVSDKMSTVLDTLKDSGLDKLQSTLETFSGKIDGLLNFFRR